jgi:hypothetical protein
MNPAPTSAGFVLVLKYFDGSGILGIWGPYATEQDAEAGKEALRKWPIEEADWSIEPLFTPLA